MTVLYGKFEKPDKVRVEEDTATNTFTRFIAEPFERGFGHTVGSALRRIMLTSLESPGIISVRLEGVPHEYTAINGIIEDMTRIILNFKGALFRKLPTANDGSRRVEIISKVFEVTQDMIDDGSGSYKVLLKDVMGNSTFEIINPDLHLFTVTKPMTKRVDIKMGIGRGYVPSERHIVEHKVVDEIIIDTIFSPIKLVNYYVENTRVGRDTDYDRLILEVETDGRITPREALTFATQVFVEQFQVFETLKLYDLAFDKEVVEENKDREEIMRKLLLKINEIELSVRSTNCLQSAQIETIGELVVMPESDMLKFRNFGKKSLNEIKQKLSEMGLMLGMDLSKYGINKDNVKDVLKQYLEEGKQEK
jgi:DNA-directed RNA polymerase subunit alpha